MHQRKARIRNLALAAVLALAAAFLTTAAVSRANGGERKAQVVPGASVLVATRDLAVGTPAAQALASGALAARTLPRTALVPGAVSRAGALRGLVVVQPVYRGEQLSAERLGPTGAQGVRSELTGRLRILRVPGDANQLLSGTLRAGDHVDVVAALKRGRQQTAYSAVVLRNLLVLEPAAQSDDASGADLAATLELTDAQAQKLFYVLRNGDWSFVLRPAAHATNGATRPDTAGSVLAGS